MQHFHKLLSTTVFFTILTKTTNEVWDTHVRHRGSATFSNAFHSSCGGHKILEDLPQQFAGEGQ